ncbi:MAG TPA: hypothetical protein VMU92_04400, partial [Acidobacteriaceae bacterium]|nr:hypothetical protein [Acidobacteriaceae bacterium]
LTPDEEEIAPAREACAPGEVLTHGPECPCGYCAETYRDAPGELHHPSCSCGFCHDTEESANESQPSHNSPSLTHHAGSEGNATPNPPTKEDAILSEVGRETANKVEEPAAAFDRPSERSEEPALPIPTLQATAADPAKAAKSFAAPSYIEPPPAESETNDKEDEQEPAPSYQSVIREYYAQLAERQAARATGDPAPRQGAFARWGGDGSSSTGHVARMPGRLALSNAKGRPVPEGIRRYNQLMAQIERNKQLAEEAWQRFVAAEQAAGRTVADPLANRAVLVTNPDGTTSKRYLTWNEEEDRRLAHRQRLREEEQSRKPA